jgi:hypothetical protein
MNRRGFLKSILAAGVAPYVVTTAGVLMPVRRVWSSVDSLVLSEKSIAQYLVATKTLLFESSAEGMIRRDLEKFLNIATEEFFRNNESDARIY